MPAFMVIVMTLTSLGLIAVLCLIGIIDQNYALAIPMGVTFLIYALLIVCLRNKIKMGIVLVKVATKFISDKPIIFLTPIIKLVLTILFAVFWLYSFSLILTKGNQQDDMG